MHPKVIEFAEFTLLPGVTPEQLDAGIESSNRFLARCPGFVARRTVRDGDRYADIAEWTDMKHALAAMEAAESSPECAPFFALLDMQNARMRHFEIVR